VCHWRLLVPVTVRRLLVPVTVRCCAVSRDGDGEATVTTEHSLRSQADWPGRAAASGPVTVFTGFPGPGRGYGRGRRGRVAPAGARDRPGAGRHRGAGVSVHIDSEVILSSHSDSLSPRPNEAASRRLRSGGSGVESGRGASGRWGRASRRLVTVSRRDTEPRRRGPGRPPRPQRRPRPPRRPPAGCLLRVRADSESVPATPPGCGRKSESVRGRLSVRVTQPEWQPEPECRTRPGGPWPLAVTVTVSPSHGHGASGRPRRLPGRGSREEPD
jgi:hypothetical protein